MNRDTSGQKHSDRDTGAGTWTGKEWSRKRMGQKHRQGQKDRERGNWTGTGMGTDKQGLGRRTAKRTGTWRNRDKEEKSDRHRDVAKGTWTVDCT